MNVDGLEKEGTNQLPQAVSIMKQLEVLKTTCEEGENAIGAICCQIAITYCLIDHIYSKQPT